MTLLGDCVNSPSVLDWHWNIVRGINAMFRDFACIPLFVVLLLITFIFAGLCYLQELALQIRVIKDDKKLKLSEAPYTYVSL